MKFAKQLEKTLADEEIPVDWLSAAIQYKALKKCINKVVDELSFLGLEKQDLKLLFEDSKADKIVEIKEQDTNASNPLIAEYSLSKIKGDDHIVPILKINLDNERLTDEHLQELGKQLKSKIEAHISETDTNEQILEVKKEGDELTLSPSNSREGTPIPAPNTKKQIYIMLNSDNKFFQMLNEELDNLDNLRLKEEKKLIDEVKNVSQEIAKLATSRKAIIMNKQGDLYNWRKLFRIYLDSEVYFRYNETNSCKGERNAQQIKENLLKFIKNVEDSGILNQFKSKQSLTAFNDFLKLNYHLLKILQFQSINSEAFRKILKKFDKQTNLGIRDTFPKLISNDHIFITGTSIAQSICYIIQNTILTLVPQLEDYTCPICMSVAYKPIKLQCNHTFCVRCLVKMKQQKKLDCPICRSKDAVVNADGENLDTETMELMEKYFPLEIKEKLREREKEKYSEYSAGSLVANTDKCNVT